MLPGMTYLFKLQLKKERKKEDKVPDTERHGLWDFSEIFCLVLQITPYAIRHNSSYFGFTYLFIHLFKYLLHTAFSVWNTKVNQTDKLSKAGKISSMISPSKALSSVLSNSLPTIFRIQSGLNSWDEAVPMLTKMMSE